MKELLILIRPHQWLKNLFVFLPLFFGGQLTNVNLIGFSLIAFFAFNFAASSIYCFNDIRDMNSDKLHPKKCKRPIASGAITKSQGYTIMIVCLVISIVVCLKAGLYLNKLLLTVLFYWLMNIAYCLKLKQLVIVDVFIIAVGFVLRVLAGGFVTNIWISHWIVLMTFLLALFLAFAKRRDDVVIYQNMGTKTRKNVERYNLEFMNQVISIIASITMVCYIMYTLSDETIARMNSHYLYATSIWVLAGIIRYLQLTIVDVKSGSPTKILMIDRFIQSCIAGWLFSFLIIIYF